MRLVINVTENDVFHAVRRIHDATTRWPSPAAIAAELDANLSQVQNRLESLRRDGSLVCRRSGPKGNRKQRWMPWGER